MRFPTILLTTALLLNSAASLPAPQQRSDSGSGSGGASGSGRDGAGSPGPPGASGSLRGSDSLRGYNPSNPVSQQSTEIPPEDFELGPGQSLDPDLGVYIDLSTVKNPQPIRGGTQDPTDPGPRKYHLALFFLPDVYHMITDMNYLQRKPIHVLHSYSKQLSS